MRYPLGLVFDSARHLLLARLRPNRKFAISVTLDPLGATGRCGSTALAPDGGGSAAGEPALTVAQCLDAVAQCRAPVVSIRGGEPLDYPEIQPLVRGVLARGKHLFVCTDGALIRRRLHMIPPYTNFFWNVKLDGTESVHDARDGRPGIFREAIDGVKAAKNAGFFVVVTTTIHPDTDIADVQGLYERLHAMHVDGYMFVPVYSRKAVCKIGSADFHRRMHQQFREADESLRGYNLMIPPVYLQFLRGERELDCCAWGSPVYGPRGWSAPCSLLNDGYAKTYAELTDQTVWENYGRGVHLKGETCLSPAGYESAALLGMNARAGDAWNLLAWQFGGNLGERREGVAKP